MKTSYSDNNDTSTSTDSEKFRRRYWFWWFGRLFRSLFDHFCLGLRLRITIIIITFFGLLVVIVVLAAHRLYATVKIKGDISMVHWYPNATKNSAAVHDVLFFTAQYEYKYEYEYVSVVSVGTSNRCSPRNNDLMTMAMFSSKRYRW